MLHIGIELVHQGGDRQTRTVAFGLIEHQSEVLAHPVHRKAEIKLARDHGLAPVVHLPALCRTLADHLQHLEHVQACLFTEGDGLTEALYQSGNANLVHHFGQLTGATLAQKRDGAGKRHGRGLG